MVDLYISKEDFRLPLAMIGQELTGEEEKLFQMLKEKIHRLNHLMKPTDDYFLDFVDSVNDIIHFDPPDTNGILRNLFRYLRAQLLSRSNLKVCNTITLCDVLVKNCGTPVHAQISRRGFMTNLALSIRRHINFHGNSKGREVGMYAFDILQGWAEAFIKRPGVCINVVKTYNLLQQRYGLRFGPQYGIGRVPIFLPDPHDEYNLPPPDVGSDSDDEEINNYKRDNISNKPISSKIEAIPDVIDLNNSDLPHLPFIDTILPFNQNPLLKDDLSSSSSADKTNLDTQQQKNKMR
jgi:hypothetical protein